MAKLSPSDASSAEEMRISKSPLEIVLLDDMAGQLFEMLEIMRKQVPQGKIDPITLAVISFLNLTRFDITPAWLSFNLINDGPDGIQFCINSAGGLLSTVNAGESLSFRFDYPVVIALYYKLVAGGASASIRVYGLY